MHSARLFVIPPPPRRIDGGLGSRHSLTRGGSAARLRLPFATLAAPVALAALVCALAALASAPAAAQTVTISASGNCGGTSGNRSGDRDTAWPGLQVDEGDTVTFTGVISPASGTYQIELSLTGAAANLTDLGQLRATGAAIRNIMGIPNRERYNFLPASGYT